MKKILDLVENKSRQPPEIDYTVYKFSVKEFILALLVKLAMMGVVAWLYYNSVIAWILMIPIAVFSLKGEAKKLCNKRKKRLELEFRETILSVASNMQIGYSVENAFREAYKEIKVLYGEESVMAVELRLLLRKISNNIQIEEALANIAVRSDVQDIMDFADIFSIAKRGGGDMKGIITNTATIIGDKQEVRREIDTVITQKKFENNIMRYMPFIVVLYVSMTSAGYFDVMYHNAFGITIMTVALAVYVAACFWSDKILDIKL
jgi:tight adherence protein B